ncbi:MAG: STAS domain-containing protein [Alphaproteobacteria bacterium]
MQQEIIEIVDITLWRVTEPEIMDTDKYLSSANAPDLEEDIRLCITSGARNMILNCNSLDYMTGAGMRAFLTSARLMQKVGGKLSITGLKGQPRDLFYACGMDALIPAAQEMASLSSIAA